MEPLSARATGMADKSKRDSKAKRGKKRALLKAKSQTQLVKRFPQLINLRFRTFCSTPRTRYWLKILFPYCLVDDDCKQALVA